ncbi:MAG: hypothetical protein ACR2G5_02395 [Pyrinomonadaceae bacterium]
MKVSSPLVRSFSILLLLIASFLICQSAALAQKRRPPRGGRIAVVVDERLSALRESPELSGKLLQRISRGRLVAVRGERRTRAGIVFDRVNLTSRTWGWVQRDALIALSRKGEDEKLLRLIRVSEDFDRIARAKIFLDSFPRSALRPAVLLLYGDTAEAAAGKLSRDASRRLPVDQLVSVGTPEFSYFLNYTGLDRYNRQGVRFVFDRENKRFHYDGASWSEITRRHPRSPEATEARKRLAGSGPGTAGVSLVNEP